MMYFKHHTTYWTLFQAGDDVLLRAMNSISEITEAMKASGIEKPVIQQQGEFLLPK